MAGSPHGTNKAGAPALDVLFDVTRELGSTFDLTTLLRRVEAAARRALDCERASLFLYDDTRDELYARVATGVDELRFSAKSGIAGQAVQTRSAIVVQDAYADPRFNREIDRKTGYLTRNMLTFPLIGHDHSVVGVLQVLNKQRGGFTGADENLADALSQLAGVAVQRQILLEEYHAKCKLEHDLDIARDIQQRLLPEKTPDFPGYDVAGWNKPADQTGGDCYDFFALPGDRGMLLVADATGHGIGPALIVSQFRATLRGVASHCTDLAEIVSCVDRLLADDLPEDRFVTAVVGVLEPAAHVLHFLSAGQGPLLHLDAASGTVRQLPANGIPMGIMPGERFEDVEPIHFKPGDVFAALTDGFFEWARPDGEQFGTERVAQILRTTSSKTCGQLIKLLHAAVVDFAQGTTQADDLTAVLVKRTG
jgi:sigma-B regulation protein RsbU (phosphoserine phosphatase)